MNRRGGGWSPGLQHADGCGDWNDISSALFVLFSSLLFSSLLFSSVLFFSLVSTLPYFSFVLFSNSSSLLISSPPLPSLLLFLFFITPFIFSFLPPSRLCLFCPPLFPHSSLLSSNTLNYTLSHKYPTSRWRSITRPLECFTLKRNYKVGWGDMRNNQTWWGRRHTHSTG